MKKIINGKVYSPDTARMIGSCSNWLDHSDPLWINETLYQKKTGEFFLVGEGGPESKYAEIIGGCRWTGGSKILPLTWEEAKEWAHNYLCKDQYDKIFGDAEDNNRRIVISLSLSSSSVGHAKRAAYKAGKSLSAYIESIIWGNK